MIILSLQQDDVLAELKEYARSDPKPQDAQEVELVISYLEALNNIFCFVLVNACKLSN